MLTMWAVRPANLKTVGWCRRTGFTARLQNQLRIVAIDAYYIHKVTKGLVFPVANTNLET